MPAIRLRRPVMVFAKASGMTVFILLFTFKTMFFVSGAVFAVLRFDSFTILARVRIMVNFTRIFGVICVEWIYLCHTYSTPNFACLSIVKPKFLHPVWYK
jgi:hypothetical protein